MDKAERTVARSQESAAKGQKEVGEQHAAPDQKSGVGNRKSVSGSQKIRQKTFFFWILNYVFWILLLSSCTLPRIMILDDTLSPEEHLNLGVTYEKKGEYDAAISEYKKASKKIPRAYVYLGNAYFEKGDLKKAEDSYKAAIRKDASLPDAYNNLAWLYYTKKENLQEAESLASKALELNPSNETYRDTLKKIRELK